MSKLDQLQGQVSSLIERRDVLRAKIAASPAEELAAREAAIRATPGKRSDTGGARSDVARIQRVRADAETELAGIERELEAASRVLQELKAQEAAGQVKRLASEIEALDTRERELIGAMVDGLEVLMEKWGDLAEFWRYRQTAPLLEGFHVTEQGVAVSMQNARGPLVEPQPLDFLAAVTMLFEVCADPRNLGARDGAPIALSRAVFQNWLGGATRDLRHLDVGAPVPPNARPTYSTNRAAPGASQAVMPEWRSGKVWGAAV